MPQVVELRSFADGSPVGGVAAGDVGGAGWIERVNPAHPDEVVGRVATVTVQQVDDAVRAAERAFTVWSRLSDAERGAMLCEAADAVAATAPELAPLLARELGKVLADCSGEMGFAAAYLRHAVDATARVGVTTELDDDLGRLRMVQRPYGVCVAIVPWNAPLILSILKVAPALATGNTMLVKPSPLAPLAVTEALTAIASRLPPGVLSVLHGDAEVGEALVGHSSVRKVAFTGGGVVARSVAGTAARNAVPVVLELGGNDAAVVLEDASLTPELFERILWGTFLTSGQVCMAAKRLYVHSSLVEDFLEGYLSAARDLLVMGDPLDPTVTIGPMAAPHQRDRVWELVSDSVRRGGVSHRLGRDSTGTDIGDGWYCEPTLVLGAADDWPIVTQEQFGPTVPLMAFDGEDEVIDRVNADEHGLASSVWSDDEDRAFALAERIEAGFTFVNCHNRAGMSLRAPFGGWKRSGYGREFGDAGIAEYLQSHAIHVPAAMRLGAKAPRRPGAANAYPTTT